VSESTEGLTLAKLLKVKKELDKWEQGNDVQHYIEFYRRPRTKKRRIIRKWMLTPGNWRLRTLVNGVSEPVKYDRIVCLGWDMAAKEGAT